MKNTIQAAMFLLVLSFTVHAEEPLKKSIVIQKISKEQNAEIRKKFLEHLKVEDTSTGNLLDQSVFADEFTYKVRSFNMGEKKALPVESDDLGKESLKFIKAHAAWLDMDKDWVDSLIVKEVNSTRFVAGYTQVTIEHKDGLVPFRHIKLRKMSQKPVYHMNFFQGKIWSFARQDWTLPDTKVLEQLEITPTLAEGTDAAYGELIGYKISYEDLNTGAQIDVAPLKKEDVKASNLIVFQYHNSDNRGLYTKTTITLARRYLVGKSDERRWNIYVSAHTGKILRVDQLFDRVNRIRPIGR